MGDMHMVIAVEDGLEHIEAYLSQRGYRIVNYPDYGGVVDAFIYKEDMIKGINQYNDSLTMDSFENNNSSSSYGVLVINANNKSEKQIEDILKSRLYSPLF